MTIRSGTPSARYAPPETGACRALACFREAEGHDRAGRRSEAEAAYDAAIEAARQENDAGVLANALRRRGILHYRRQEHDAARALCRESHDVAVAHGARATAGEALNALAGFDLESGDHDSAQRLLREARALCDDAPALRARVDQNLGIIANIQGDLRSAQQHYLHALSAWRTVGDRAATASTYNCLGMVSADRGMWDEADQYYRLCLEATEATGDVYLRGLALMNQTEVFLAREQYELAHRNAEESLAIFDRLGEKRHTSETYKILGVVYRETGRDGPAEARLRAAVELAAEVAAPLEEAEATRELALLYQRLNRNQDALRLLSTAHRLFKRLDARRDMVDVDGKMADLEGTYLRVVREWGQSIESADSYTHGHCERVAGYAVAVARQLDLHEDEITTVRLGAYLHDVGKVRVPAEILNKPGKLTDAEFAVMQQHPLYGIELLAGIEFPWDIKPIIRWHHEKHDGTGYPDRLAGDEIPLHAQIICIADVYDALTTTRSYRPALSPEQALGIMYEERRGWRPDVFAAFEVAVGRGGPPRSR